jgi:hypothetical protein
LSAYGGASSTTLRLFWCLRFGCHSDFAGWRVKSSIAGILLSEEPATLCNDGTSFKSSRNGETFGSLLLRSRGGPAPSGRRRERKVAASDDRPHAVRNDLRASVQDL